MKRNILLKRGAILLGLYIFVALVLLISAGNFYFGKAWLFLALSFFPVLITVIILSLNKTRILEINIDITKIIKENLIKIIIFSLIFVIGLIVAGINCRQNINQFPLWITIQFSVIYLFGFILFISSCKEYKILSRNLFEHRRKKLIDQGPYSIVRHPMYSSLILMSLSIPIVLGSFITFIIYLFFPIYMIIIMFKEEKELKEEIKDYEDYKERVKFKIIPYIW